MERVECIIVDLHKPVPRQSLKGVIIVSAIFVVLALLAAAAVIALRTDLKDNFSIMQRSEDSKGKAKRMQLHQQIGERVDYLINEMGKVRGTRFDKQTLFTRCSRGTYNYIMARLPYVRKKWKNIQLKELSKKAVLQNKVAYTVNKGDQIKFYVYDCTADGCKLLGRTKNRGVPMGDKEVLNYGMYVLLHELAHIVFHKKKHPGEYWVIKKAILIAAQNIGIYEFIDFEKTPWKIGEVYVDSNIEHISDDVLLLIKDD